MTTATLDLKPEQSKLQPQEPREDSPLNPQAQQEAESKALRKVSESALGSPIGVRRPKTKPSVKSLPDQMKLGALRDKRYRVIKPIDVKFGESEGQAIAQADAFDEFGFGKTRQEALGDLQVTLVELYDTLAEEHASLGPELQLIWDRMKDSIERREYQT